MSASPIQSFCSLDQDVWALQPRGFCPLRRRVIICDDDEFESDDPLFFDFGTNVCLCGHLNEPFGVSRHRTSVFEAVIDLDCQNYSIVLTYDDPSLFDCGFAFEYNYFPLISWQKALYFTLVCLKSFPAAICIMFILFALNMIFRRCAYWLCFFLVYMAWLCLRAFGWFMSNIFDIFHLASFWISVWCVFGYSVTPFALVCSFTLVRDLLLFGRMRQLSYMDEVLILNRKKALSILMNSSVSRVQRTIDAYRSIPGSIYSRVSKFQFANKSRCYFWDGKPITPLGLCRVMEGEISLLLQMNRSFAFTTSTPKQWNFVHLFLASCGSDIESKHSLMIQECLLFVGKVIYAMTDTRTARYGALAADLITFRNSSCGMAMSDLGFEYFSDTAKQFVKDISTETQPSIRRDFSKSRDFGRAVSNLQFHELIVNRAAVEGGDIGPEGYVLSSFSFSDVGSLLGRLERGLREQALKRILQLIAIAVALISFCGKENFSLEGMTRVTKAIRAQPFDEGLDLAAQLVSLLKWLGEAGWHLFAFPSSVATSVDAVANWRTAAEEILQVKTHANYTNILGTGVVDQDGTKIPLSVFRTRASTLIKTDWKLVESSLRISSSKFVMSEFKTLHQKLVAFDSELQAQLLSQTYRKAPFGLALVGGTSVGKSTITNLIFAYYSSLRGFAHLPEMIFSHPSYSEFWDTYFGQDYILFDDVGAIHPQSKSEDKSLYDVLQVFNNAPYIVPMAQVDAKGTRCVTAKLGIATSNIDDLGARNNFAHPAAVLRRFNLMVKMTVKPAFACTLGRLSPPLIASWTAADNAQRASNPNLRLQYSQRFPPFWNFDIMEIDDNGPTGRSLRTFNDPSSATVDFLKFVFQNVENHEKNQDRVMNSFASLNTVDICRNCQFPMDTCVCANSAGGYVLTVGPPSRPAFEDDEDDESMSSYLFLLFLAFMFFFSGFFFYSVYSGQITALLKSVILWLSHISFVIVSVQCLKGYFISRVHLEPVTSSAKLPLTMLKAMFGRCDQSFRDLFNFGKIVVVGGFTRKAWLDACIDGIRTKVSRFFCSKNALVVILTACIVAVVAGPLFKMVFSEKWMLTTKSNPDLLESPPVRQMPQEDSRSAYYNPNPPQRTMSELSKCLSGASSSPWVENSLRKATCNIRVFNSANEILGDMKGLAIGGTLILSVAHGFVVKSSPSMASSELEAVHGEITFPSVNGLSSKHRFRLSPGSYVMDLKKDIFLFDAPSVPSRSSLIDYFIETNDILDSKYVCRLVEPGSWNILSDFRKVVPGSIDFRGGFVSGFLDESFKLDSAIPWGEGFSGSTLVAQSLEGTSILGIQSMAREAKSILVSFVGRSQLKNMIRNLTSSDRGQFSFIAKGPIIGLDSKPEILNSGPTGTNPLLHHAESCGQENFNFVGALKTACGKGKSSVGIPPYAGFFFTRGYAPTKVAPTFDYKSKRHYLQQIGKISNKIDVSVVDQARDSLLLHWKGRYRELGEIGVLQPLSLEEAINGSDDVTWVESLKFNTSAGHPWNKPKLNILEVRDSDRYARGYEYFLPPNVYQDFRLYFSSLIDSMPMNYPYKGTQKDEPISADKNETRGPRIFCAANLFVIIAGRILFGSYIRLAQRNIFVSWAAVGVNASSKVWGLLWRWISFFGTNRIMAGDYSNFDQNMSPVFTRAAYAIIIGLLVESNNFPPELIQAARAWASEAINPTVILDSDVFCIAGTNPSGNPLTVHINCIVNVLFILYVWIAIGNKVDLFFVQVRMMTYGDDNLISVSTEVSNFHYWIIHITLKEIGVLYTPADKSDPQHKLFDLLCDITFLKRGFRLHDDYCFAPLERASFCKTFTCWMVSKEPDQSHGLDTLCACWENAAHLDAPLQQRIHQDILDACDFLGWPKDKFKPLAELHARFREAEVNRWPQLLRQAGFCDDVGIAPASSECLGRMIMEISPIQLLASGDSGVWHIAFYAPIYEELLKCVMVLVMIGWCCVHDDILGGRWTNYFLSGSKLLQLKFVASLIFGLFEFYARIFFGMNPILALPALVTHTVAGTGGIVYGIFVHMVFNCFTIWLNAACFPPVVPGSMFTHYNEHWQEMAGRAVRFMYHGLTFFMPTETQVFTRWYSIQDSAWCRIRQWIPHDCPLGPGIFPLLDNEFDGPLDDESEEDEEFTAGAFDGFFHIEGPNDREGELESFPSAGPE